MNLCPRHDDALVMALELRGLLRPTLTADADLTPLRTARNLIETHCTHLATAVKVAVKMLTSANCPLCFCQRIVDLRRSDANLNDWIDQAAEEALDLDIARVDRQRSA